jgi:hypothetical protein
MPGWARPLLGPLLAPFKLPTLPQGPVFDEEERFIWGNPWRKDPGFRSFSVPETREERTALFLELTGRIGPLDLFGTGRRLQFCDPPPGTVGDWTDQMTRLVNAGIDPDADVRFFTGYRPFMRVDILEGEDIALELWEKTDVASWLALNPPEKIGERMGAPGGYRFLHTCLDRGWGRLFARMVNHPDVSAWLDQIPGSRSKLLCSAIFTPRPEVMRMVLEAGFSPNMRLWTDHGEAQSALHCLVFSCDSRMNYKTEEVPALGAVLDVMLEFGADPDAKSGMDYSALYYARKNQPEWGYRMEQVMKMRQDKVALNALPEAAIPVTQSPPRRRL